MAGFAVKHNLQKNEKQKKDNESSVDWNKQIENAMLKVTAIMTLWLLIDRANAE